MASAALAAMSAPAARNTSSEKRERPPAPDCTFTVQPNPFSFFTVSGETATRASSRPFRRDSYGDHRALPIM